MRIWITAVLVAAATPALSQGAIVAYTVQNHILPRYDQLVETSAALAGAAAQDCNPTSEPLIAAYHTAFDAWVGVSHLRFGPSEADNRAFALAFWPDPRGTTPKALTQLLTDADPAVETPESFADVSIAARGFYALEYLLFDPALSDLGSAEYRCDLVQAITADIAGNAEAISADWQQSYADLMITTGNATYRSDLEAAQQLFTALSTGAEFTSQTRLGRPLGTFDQPRPNRAEARRSERSLRHVVVSLEALQDLAGQLSQQDPALAHAFDKALARAEALDDPAFAGVADPQARFRVEVLQQDVEAVRQVLAEDLGPSLGISAGFNSLDGD